MEPVLSLLAEHASDSAGAVAVAVAGAVAGAVAVAAPAAKPSKAGRFSLSLRKGPRARAASAEDTRTYSARSATRSATKRASTKTRRMFDQVLPPLPPPLPSTVLTAILSPEPPPVPPPLPPSLPSIDCHFVILMPKLCRTRRTYTRRTRLLSTVPVLRTIELRTVAPARITNQTA